MDASGATDCVEWEEGEDITLDLDSNVGQDYPTLRDSTVASSYSATEGQQVAKDYPSLNVLNSWQRAIPPLRDKSHGWTKVAQVCVSAAGE